ncbi:MAG: YbaB/EbfC family nucleoid-associated protein [Clostridiales bacterium]|nr:YbaB/EbfC family nucleoid-associated protein [Clostridiales bacterium]MBQ2818695.1 YbaB/EbfC family nucleoid-associated protein [Clostridia bacterium]
MAKGRGGFPGMGMGGGNFQAAIMKAQKMQQQVMAKQAELEKEELEANAGGGMVNVKVNGKKEILSISIKPEAVDPDDVEMLEDMVMAAVNEALRMVDEMTEREMGKITGGMNLGL